MKNLLSAIMLIPTLAISQVPYDMPAQIDTSKVAIFTRMPRSQYGEEAKVIYGYEVVIYDEVDVVMPEYYDHNWNRIAEMNVLYVLRNLGFIEVYGDSSKEAERNAKLEGVPIGWSYRWITYHGEKKITHFMVRKE